jgi:hypothetical protein
MPLYEAGYDLDSIQIEESYPVYPVGRYRARLLEMKEQTSQKNADYRGMKFHMEFTACEPKPELVGKKFNGHSCNLAPEYAKWATGFKATILAFGGVIQGSRFELPDNAEAEFEMGIRVKKKQNPNDPDEKPEQENYVKKFYSLPEGVK